MLNEFTKYKLFCVKHGLKQSHINSLKLFKAIK